MIIYVGSLLIFFSIGFLVLAFSLAGYLNRVDKHIEKFEKKGNKILTWQIIDNLCKKNADSNSKSISKLIDIFYSAVIDHSKIDGIKYYTKYPYSIFQIFAGHDGHRRSFICMCLDKIIQNNKLPDSHFDKVVEILLRLTNSFREYSYTQLLAWNSLSNIASVKDPVFGTFIQKQDLLKRLAKKGISGIGAQKLVFTLLARCDLDSKLREDIDEIIKYIFNLKHFTLKAISYYKIKTASYLTEDEKSAILKGLKLSSRLHNVIKEIDQFSYGYSMDDITIGLKNLGICSPPYDKSSSEGRIVSKLVEESMTEICLPAFIYHFNGSRVKNRESYDGVSIFEKDDPRRKYLVGEQNIRNLFNDNMLTLSDNKKESKDINSGRNEKEDRKDLKGLKYFDQALKNLATNMANPNPKAKRKA